MQAWNEETGEWEHRDDTPENLIDAIKQNLTIIRQVLGCVEENVENGDQDSLEHALDHLPEVCGALETTGSFLFRLLPQELRDEKVRTALEQKLGVMVKDVRFIAGGNVAMVGYENPDGEKFAEEARMWLNGEGGDKGE